MLLECVYLIVTFAGCQLQSVPMYYHPIYTEPTNPFVYNYRQYSPSSYYHTQRVGQPGQPGQPGLSGQSGHFFFTPQQIYPSPALTSYILSLSKSAHSSNVNTTVVPDKKEVNSSCTTCLPPVNEAYSSRNFSPRLMPVMFEFVGPHARIIENIGRYRGSVTSVMDKTNSTTSETDSDESGSTENVQKSGQEPAPVKSEPSIAEETPVASPELKVFRNAPVAPQTIPAPENSQPSPVLCPEGSETMQPCSGLNDAMDACQEAPSCIVPSEISCPAPQDFTNPCTAASEVMEPSQISENKLGTNPEPAPQVVEVAPVNEGDKETASKKSEVAMQAMNEHLDQMEHNLAEMMIAAAKEEARSGESSNQDLVAKPEPQITPIETPTPDVVLATTKEEAKSVVSPQEEVTKIQPEKIEPEAQTTPIVTPKTQNVVLVAAKEEAKSVEPSPQKEVAKIEPEAETTPIETSKTQNVVLAAAKEESKSVEPYPQEEVAKIEAKKIEPEAPNTPVETSKPSDVVLAQKLAEESPSENDI